MTEVGEMSNESLSGLRFGDRNSGVVSVSNVGIMFMQ